jgi:alanyl-tRNA synthetase
MSKKPKKPAPHSKTSKMPAPHSKVSDLERFAVDQLVKDFLEFFWSKQHQIVPSAPLLPEDPTLLFTAAGMVPFKSYYSAPDNAPFSRAASVQKCLRAGGKQSDLENVGRTLRHHTFFEMLGNFSFGDYFKKEAIEWGWELSVDVWGLDKDRLWISVFNDDDEAFELWEKHIGFPRERMVRMGKADNFWGPVGDTGVCGPSSEMYYDTQRGGDDGAKPGDTGTDDRFIEYWNLVFPQFFYAGAGVYDPLPRPGIDTGLGLERLAFILQDAPDNYHTDEFLPIRQCVERVLPDDETRKKASFAVNVAADHVRALTFALTEGIMPSNEGRGYVLRRLLRRALTKMQPFGVTEPFLAPAVDVVIEKMGGRYPEIRERGDLVKEVITAEEERFLSTLEQGMAKLEAILDKASAGKHSRVGGKDAFLLYDTYGFPLELTEELAEDRGLTVERDGFEAAMAEQKNRGRQSSFHEASRGDVAEYVEIGVADTTEFDGYDRLTCTAQLMAYCIVESGSDDGREVDLVTDRTVFYAESGGQVGDTGRAVIGDQRLEITDTQYSNGRIVHRAVWPGEEPDKEIKDFLNNHARVELAVDEDKRLATMRNHTATHLLHSALRRVLGDHVAQAGSLVAPDRLRFDFHHFQSVREDEVTEVERIVNDAVMADYNVTKKTMPYKEAVAAGAMALFGEKYAESVRVVSVADVSMELCGGTHLGRTGEVGAFLVKQESAIGAGIRRIEALTGRNSIAYARDAIGGRRSVAELLRVGTEDVEQRVRALIGEADALQRQLKKDASKRAKNETADAVAQAEEVGGVKFVSIVVDAPDVGALRNYGDELRNKLGLGMGIVSQNKVDKPVVLIVASDELIADKSITAVDITKRIAKELGFRGGGKPHMAQVGIPDLNTFENLRKFVLSELDKRTR